MTTPQQLQDIWHKEIPISKAMGIEIESYDGVELVVTAPLSANFNVHQTGFAGSLYAINALCGWGMVYLQLDQEKINADIVIADGQIKYQRPVSEDITAVCRFENHEAAMALLKCGKKARFNLTSSIQCAGKDAAVFTGVYAVRPKS
jgi:thioesterase domain-containing protein